MKHFIFGGNGFLGQALAQDLTKKGFDVIIIDHNFVKSSQYQQFTLDVTEPNISWNLPIGPEDQIYHLIARQYHDVVPKKNRQAWFDQVNILGTRNILDFLVKKNCKNIIFFSTDMVYGYPNEIPIKETHSLNPIGYYGKSKKNAEILCQEFRNQGMNITIFRPRLITGPGRLGVLEKLFKLIHHGLPVPLIGNGSNFYQMISVFDCVNAISLAVEKKVINEIFNLGSDNPPTVHALLSHLIEKVHSQSRLIKTPARLIKGILSSLDRIRLSPLHQDQYKIADKNYLVSTEKAKKLLGWQPKFNDENMLVEAYLQYQKNLMKLSES